MSATPEVVEGTWEEISLQSAKFNGHRPRVTILPDEEPEKSDYDGTLRTLPPTGRGAARLRARLAAKATDDPEEIRKAQEELDEMKRSMNAERQRSGAEQIF